MENLTYYKDRLKQLNAIVIVPTYNNCGTIADVISGLKEYSYDIMIVNDGSTDNTLDILNSIDGIQVQSYPVNQGKGYALKYGLGKAYEQGFRYAITIDAAILILLSSEWNTCLEKKFLMFSQVSDLTNLHGYQIRNA